MTAKPIVSGVGARRMEAFILNNITGLPDVGFNSGTLVAGTMIQGIDTFDYNSPEPQRITHYGNDRPFAQDALPPTEVGSFTVTTAKTNLSLDTFFDGTKLVMLDTVVPSRLGNSNKRGNEPQTFSMVYRQALDTQDGSDTFGKLRQWHAAIVPSARFVTNLQPMQQTKTTKTYNGIPTIVTQTPWGAAFDEATWGATQGEYIEQTYDYKPSTCCGLSNGTLATFALPVVPIDVAHTHVWVGGTLATVSSVSTSTTNPSVTVSSVTGTGGQLVFAIVENNQAG